MANRKTQAARTATEALRILWEEGFFRSWKKKAAVEQSLAKRGNHFSDAELGMALKRGKHLTRRGKRGGYEYIQKYPFAVDQERAASAARKRTPSKGRAE
jgi:hypothetical protein